MSYFFRKVVIMPDSKAFSLNWIDVKNLGKNAGLVGIAAALTYVGQNLGGLDLGASGIVAGPILAILIDAVVKWSNNNVKDTPDTPA